MIDAKRMRIASSMAVPFGAVPVTCWCESEIVFILESEIGVTTKSCGRSRCRPS